LQQKAQGKLRPEDPEQYQQRALSQWLPVGVADKDSDAYKAISGLAEVFAEHQDFWWRDFLQYTKLRDLEAVRGLSTAVLNNEQGRYDDALAQSRTAAKLFNRNGNRSGELFSELQEVYALRSKLEGASCLARADPLIQQLSRTAFGWLRAQSLLERAQCRNFQVELAKADADSLESLQTAKQFHLPVLNLRVLGITAGIKRQQGKYEDAWTLGVQGLGLYWKGDYPPERLDQFYAVMLQSAEDSGLSFLAEAMLRHIIDSREQPNSRILRNPIREGMLHLVLANLLKARPDNNNAEKETKIASHLLEAAAHSYPEDFTIFSSLKPAEHDLQHQETERSLATLKAMRGLIEHTQYKGLALNYYRLLGNVHLRLHDLEEAGTSFESAIQIADEALESIKNADDRMSWRQATEESYRGAVRVLLAQKKEKLALERWEQYKSWPALQGLSVGEMRASSDALKSIGQSNNPSLPLFSSPTVRIVYASFPDGLQIWALKNKSIQSSWISVARQDLENEVHLFAEQCANPDSSLMDIDRQGRRLYSILLQPLPADFLESQAIIIEPDRSLYGLSIEGLRTPSGRYFGEKYSVIYSPGIWMERRLRKPEPIGSAASLLLIDATHSDSSGYLPGMEAERKGITRLFARSTVIDAESANWSKLRTQLPTSDVFHFMGHGRAGNGGTDLVLSEKQFLGSADFTPDLLAHSEMVVLAACSSGKSSKGFRDTQNLVYSFLNGGVPWVVASHWNVDSESTSKLMISFYQHVATDQTAAQAMFNARKDVIALNPHPYYWAGFSVTGRVN